MQILDVNVGLPEIDEVKMMQKAIYELQAVLDLPLQIDTASPLVMEKAMRLYNGKPLVNSVNGKEESMETVFPLVAKYGGVIIALTLDAVSYTHLDVYKRQVFIRCLPILVKKLSPGSF